MKHLYILLTIFLGIFPLKGNCVGGGYEETHSNKIAFVSAVAYPPLFMMGRIHEKTHQEASTAATIGKEAPLSVEEHTLRQKKVNVLEEKEVPKSSAVKAGGLQKIVGVAKSVGQFIWNHPIPILVGGALIYSFLMYDLQKPVKESFIKFVMDPGRKIAAKVVLRVAWWDFKMDVKLLWRDIVKVAGKAVMNDLAHERLLFSVGNF